MRPKFNNIFAIYLPITALCSILHRLSGVIISLSIPLLLFYLAKSLESELAFDAWFGFANMSYMHKSINVCIMLAFAIHILAGIRHLIADLFHIGDSLHAGRITATLVMVVFVISSFYIVYNYLIL